MLNMRGYKDDWDFAPTLLFLNHSTGKEINIASSRKLLAQKVKEAVLLEQHVKGHSLRIGGATS